VHKAEELEVSGVCPVDTENVRDAHNLRKPVNHVHVQDNLREVVNPHEIFEPKRGHVIFVHKEFQSVYCSQISANHSENAGP